MLVFMGVVVTVAWLVVVVVGHDARETNDGVDAEVTCLGFLVEERRKEI